MKGKLVKRFVGWSLLLAGIVVFTYFAWRLQANPLAQQQQPLILFAGVIPGALLMLGLGVLRRNPKKE